MKKPNPGSKEAQGLGCTCPVIDNHYGAGMPHSTGPRFWITSGCPLHGLCEACGAQGPDQHIKDCPNKSERSK